MTVVYYYFKDNHDKNLQIINMLKSNTNQAAYTKSTMEQNYII